MHTHAPNTTARILAAASLAIAALLLAVPPAHGQDLDALLDRLRDGHAAWLNGYHPDRGKAMALRVVRAEGLAPLVQALQTADAPTTRRAAARALGLVGDQRGVETLRAVETLVATLRAAGEDPSVRAAAALALGFIDDERAIAPLADVLRGDDDAGVRAAAARGLGLIGGEPARAPLIEALRQDESAEVRRAASWALEIV